VLQRNPVTNRRASHCLITGASRNNHAVEPCIGCYSWIKQEFEADFDNVEHVSIMNDNWDFDRVRGDIIV